MQKVLFRFANSTMKNTAGFAKRQGRKAPESVCCIYFYSFVAICSLQT